MKARSLLSRKSGTVAEFLIWSWHRSFTKRIVPNTLAKIPAWVRVASMVDIC